MTTAPAQADATSRLIADLQAMIHARLAPLVGNRPLALLDFPDIRNVGDSAIWLGEIAYLRTRFAKSPAYVAKMRIEPEKLERAVPDGPIFIHGGGNFGDIWHGHQVFREKVLKHWKDRPVIQFPQSIHYGSAQAVERTAHVIGEHRDFTLMVRDEESLHFARKHFDCAVELCPDMAFCIGKIARTGEPQVPVLAMLREDKEKAVSGNSLATAGMPVEDWITESRGSIRMVKTLSALGAAWRMDTLRMRAAMFDAAANARFARGVRQLSRARAIVTDRLHVHIVSLLLGIPHAVLDNSYGKIGRVMQAFGTDTDLVYRARSLDDAVEWARMRAEVSA